MAAIAGFPGAVLNHLPSTDFMNPFMSANAKKLAAETRENNPGPFGNADTVKKLMGTVGANPDDVKAVTPGEHVARAAGEGAVSMAIPGIGAEALLARASTVDGAITAALSMVRGTGTASNAALGAATGAAGEGAAEAAPESLKPTARLLGGLAGGVGAAGAMAGGKAATGAVRDAYQVVMEPAEMRAARTISSRATEPGKFGQDVAEAAEAPQLVPGSTPTTFQATGDLGVGGLEREVAASPKGGPAFAARRGEQNAARLEALGDLADPAADSQVVTDYVRSRLAAITEEHANNVASATRGVADTLAQAGGQHFDNPAAYGEALQVPLSGLHQKRKLPRRSFGERSIPTWKRQSIQHR